MRVDLGRSSDEPGSDNAVHESMKFSSDFGARTRRLRRTELLRGLQAIEDLGRRSGCALLADVRDAEEVLRESTGEMFPL